MSEKLQAVTALPFNVRKNRRTTDKKTDKFRKLLQSDKLEFICEAHNGLSAKICEEAGFKGIWASGLCLSAQFGVRDSNEASWTQLIDMLEFMSDATSIPIMLDGDTGYGNFNNMRRLVIKLEQRDIAAVCIEDKLFPKTNSFINSREHPLADIDEFCGKIKAAKDAQTDDSFSVVARIESLIAGWGMEEALRRAEAYHAAGADAILIHSAKSKADEVLTFKKEWGNRAPVVIVPTKYYSTPTAVFREHGFSMVIWANHILRSAVSAMQATAKQIQQEECLHSIEDGVVSVGEIFRLQGAQELQAAEERYLPARADRTQAIILAAGRGSALGELTSDRPKTMITVRNKSLLSHIVDAYNAAGISKLSVVRGYCKETVKVANVDLVDNDDYAQSGELYSLHLALQGASASGVDTIVSYGDVLFRKYILEAVLETEEDFVIAVDAAWQDSANRDRAADYVTCSKRNQRNDFYSNVTLQRMSEDVLPSSTHGEWMGIVKISASALERLATIVREIVESPKQPGRNADLPFLFNELIARGESIRVLYTTGNWLDVDSVEDVVASSSFR